MATLSFNQRNKTIKVFGDVKINGLLKSLGIESDQWDGWILMPTNSVINEPDKVVHFYDTQQQTMQDLIATESGFNTPIQMNDVSTDTLPEEYPVINTNYIPNDGC